VFPEIYQAVEEGQIALARRRAEWLQPFGVDPKAYVDGVIQFLDKHDADVRDQLSEVESFVCHADNVQRINRLSDDAESVRSASAEAESVENVFRRTGKEWQIAYADAREGPEQFLHLKGFEDIRQLLSSPNRRFTCAELAGEKINNAADDVVDKTGQRAIWSRIREIQQERERAEQIDDRGTLDLLDDEYESIMRRLNADTDRRGRPRKLGGEGDRIRLKVTRPINLAIARIAERMPQFGKHLKTAVVRGSFCCYLPDRRITWTTI
ncbi:MAG: hypothetical protein V3T70_11260, partial [Phycisphaerae bacterium]